MLQVSGLALHSRNSCSLGFAWYSTATVWCPVSSARAFLECSAAEYETFLLRTIDEECVNVDIHAAKSLLRVLRSQEAMSSTRRCWNWKSSSLEIGSSLRNGHWALAENFGGNCFDGLSMALWAVSHTNSFDAAVCRAANLLGAAGSTSVVAGQIAGAIYGYKTFSPAFVNEVKSADGGETSLRGALIYFLAGYEGEQRRKRTGVSGV